jgi:hypothetical protein
MVIFLLAVSLSQPVQLCGRKEQATTHLRPRNVHMIRDGFLGNARRDDDA